MVRSGIEGNVIKYSPGNYGRPLLHSVQAGEFVANVIEKQILDSHHTSTTNQVQYETIVVPGHFVSFKTFALLQKMLLRTEIVMMMVMQQIILRLRHMGKRQMNYELGVHLLQRGLKSIYL